MNFNGYLGNIFDQGVWTGWWDEPKEGEWTSITASKLLSNQLFLPWLPGQPNGLKLENCGSLHIAGNKGIWIDTRCATKHLCVACQILSKPVFVLRGK